MSCGFTGSQFRTKQCVPGICGPACPPGPFIDVQSCGSDGFSMWSAWSNCSTSCGYGVQIATRTALGCPGATGATLQTQQCAAGSLFDSDCGLAEWGCRRAELLGRMDGQRCVLDTVRHWLHRRVPHMHCCLPGHVRRQQLAAHAVHTRYNVEHHQLNSCDAGIANYWSSWSAWSACVPVTCNTGNIWSTRKCLGCFGGCAGSANQSQPCELNNCAVNCVAQWQPWAACSATCGTGMQVALNGRHNNSAQARGRGSRL